MDSPSALALGDVRFSLSLGDFGEDVKPRGDFTSLNLAWIRLDVSGCMSTEVGVILYSCEAIALEENWEKPCGFGSFLIG